MEGSSVEHKWCPEEPSITVGLLPRRETLNKAIVEKKAESYRECRERREEERPRHRSRSRDRRVLHDFVAHPFIECQDDFQRADQDEERSSAVSPH